MEVNWNKIKQQYFFPLAEILDEAKGEKVAT